jgi:predicted secreted protein
MAYPVQGKNVIFRAVKLGDYRVWACAQSLRLNVSTDVVETSTPVTGRHKTFSSIGLTEWSATLSGVLFLRDQAAVKNFVLETLTETIIDNGYDITITFTDDEGYINVFTGSVLVPSTEISKETGSLSKWSIEFKGNGEYALTTLVDPAVTATNIISDSYTVSGGKITDIRWDGLTIGNIIEVCREGSEQLSLGLPFTFDEPTTSITPDPATTIDGQRMFVIWKY